MTEEQKKEYFAEKYIEFKEGDIVDKQKVINELYEDGYALKALELEEEFAKSLNLPDYFADYKDEEMGNIGRIKN